MDSKPYHPADIDPAATTEPIHADTFISAIQNTKTRARLDSLSIKDQIDWASLFPKADGMGASRDINRRVKMLKSIESRAEYLLYPGEQIEYVTKGTLNSFVEQYFLGIWSFFINRTLFLFTNYRVILLSSNKKGQAKRMMWQIPYQGIRKFRTGFISSGIKFRLFRGRSYRFFGVPSRDRKSLKAYMKSRIDSARSGEIEFPHHKSRDPLCTSCATPIPPKTYTCPACSEEFIKPYVPALMSLAIPGLGDLYLGHHVIAAFELIGFALLMLLAVLTALEGTADAIIFAIAMVAVANFIDAAITHHIAHKGILGKQYAWEGLLKK